MSRLHGRNGDWSLEMTRDWPDDTYLLSVRVTPAQASQLAKSHGYRGNMSFRPIWPGDDSMLYATHIEVTRKEAEEIHLGKVHPLDVLLGWAGLGYRLTAVEDWSLS
jgi:hypothetical protein